MTIKQTDKAVLTQRCACVCVMITRPKDVMKRHLAEGFFFFFYSKRHQSLHLNAVAAASA